MKIGRLLDFAADNVGNLLFAFYAVIAVGSVLAVPVVILLER